MGVGALGTGVSAIKRLAARVLVIDPAGHVLLFRGFDPGRPGDGSWWLTPGGGVDAGVVFSGDGGFNEALNGLESDVPIGFLPGGGTSVLPRALGLSRNPVAAARQVAEYLPGDGLLGFVLSQRRGRLLYRAEPCAPDFIVPRLGPGFA